MGELPNSDTKGRHGRSKMPFTTGNTLKQLHIHGKSVGARLGGGGGRAWFCKRMHKSAARQSPHTCDAPGTYYRGQQPCCLWRFSPQTKTDKKRVFLLSLSLFMSNVLFGNTSILILACIYPKQCISRCPWMNGQIPVRC